MKNKRANLLVNVICALLICVFGGVSVYATVEAINYRYNTASSISFNATSVTGTVAVSLSGTTIDETYNGSTTPWVFDAYSSSAQTATHQFTFGTSAEKLVMSGNEVSIIILITNRSPDAKMNVELNGYNNENPIDFPSVTVDEFVNGGNENVANGGVERSEVRFISGAINDFTSINAGGATSQITIRIAIQANTMLDTSSAISFYLNLTRGDYQAPA